MSNTYKKYYSLAQSFSTHYLLAQVRFLNHEDDRGRAYRDVLKSRDKTFRNTIEKNRLKNNTRIK